MNILIGEEVIFWAKEDRSEDSSVECKLLPMLIYHGILSLPPLLLVLLKILIHSTENER